MKFGLTQAFACSYLPAQQEQLLVVVPDDDDSQSKDYELLLENGFRRSGSQVYRPHCQQCSACQSIRIPVDDFMPSKSQKRVWNKNQDLSVFLSTRDKQDYYWLYQQYIDQRHSDGSMFPATEQQYSGFVDCDWIETQFLEIYLGNELIGVAVTDVLNHALSALYTFFKPEYEQRSLGTYAIMQQINRAKLERKSFLYLGYQVDGCQKMNYKSNFYPHQRFFNSKWQHISKKSR